MGPGQAGLLGHGAHVFTLREMGVLQSPQEGQGGTIQSREVLLLTTSIQHSTGSAGSKCEEGTNPCTCP